MLLHNIIVIIIIITDGTESTFKHLCVGLYEKIVP